MSLEDFGWNAELAGHFAPYVDQDYAAGRITLEQKNLYAVATAAYGEIPAVLTGRYYFDTVERGDLPVVGDWAVLRLHPEESAPKATIHGLLPRRSLFSRRDPGRRGGEQPVAANIDTALIVIGLDGNFRLHRIERYLTVAWESGAAPVVLLTKADLCDDVAARVRETEESAPGVPVHAVSARTGAGLVALDPHLAPGRTLALLGSSGVGKSTLLNYWLGADVQRVQEVRSFDDKGRHSTTHRQLFRLPGGALLIDTPGMRELQLWQADDGLAGAFPEIDALAAQCRYRDCAHQDEPGCRVRAAVDNGDLPVERLEHYHRLRRELRYQASREDREVELAIKQEHKRLHKQIKAYFKQKHNTSG